MHFTLGVITIKYFENYASKAMIYTLYKNSKNVLIKPISNDQICQYFLFWTDFLDKRLGKQIYESWAIDPLGKQRTWPKTPTCNSKHRDLYLRLGEEGLWLLPNFQLLLPGRK